MLRAPILLRFSLGLSLAALQLALATAASAECPPETAEEELRCTPQYWDNINCVCRAPVSTDPCVTGDVASCYQQRMAEFQQRVAAAEEELANLRAFCRELQAWARSSGYNVPLHPCEQ